MTVEATPLDTLVILYEIARKYLSHVYIGNVGMETGRDTICPSCGKKIIVREYKTDYSKVRGGKCTYCKRPLEGEGYE